MEPEPKNKGSKTIFQNNFLERLTRTHIAVPLTLFVAYSTALILWSRSHTSLSAQQTAIIFLSGILSWTLTEYLLHRFLFHHDVGSPFQYTIHGVHHEYPKDKDRLAMPPLVSILIATILLLITNWLLADAAFPFMAGFISGYVMYLCVHYMVHTFAPPKNIFKTLWINHSMHHYKNGNSFFGVSSPLWDFIFGTSDERKAN